MIENIFAILALIWFFGSIIFILIFSMIADQDNKTLIKALKDLTIELFLDKNWFGILLSVLVCIILIPSYIFSLIIKAVCIFCKLLSRIWKLGEKR